MPQDRGEQDGAELELRTTNAHRCRMGAPGCAAVPVAVEGVVLGMVGRRELLGVLSGSPVA
jgi:hypothetical protein